MPIELSEAQLAVVQETKAVDTPAEFQTLLQAVRPEMDRVVRVPMEPNQPLPTTLTELRDLLLTMNEHGDALAGVSYGPERRTLFVTSVRLLDTARIWFGEGARQGVYRPRSVKEVVDASRPWRARIKAYGAHAYALDEDRANEFADVNTTGTLQEEIDDLSMLLGLAKLYRAELARVGMTDAFITQGEALLSEAESRDLLGILGLRNQEEGLTLRNKIATLATLLGKEARAAGVNACWDLPEARQRFEAASFRNALRRLRPRRRGAAQGEPEGDVEPAADRRDDSPT